MAKKPSRARSRKPKKIRIGVVGVGRGQTFARGATDAVGMELVALCDIWEERLKTVSERFGVKGYVDYDKFLEHDMDAVVLANYFHQHAPFAIKALNAGKHVMTETSCNFTMAEGVALCRTVEETGLTYMLAENYPYTVFNQEMRRLYQAGEIGDVLYAEGEYNHPMNPRNSLAISIGMDHWRNWLPSTYYCTHALAPLMCITDRMPVKVNALSIARPASHLTTVKVDDLASVILCRMDNGAVFRLINTGLPGHSNWYRLHGAGGAMESVRGPGYFGPEQVRVWHEPWNCPPETPRERVYIPDWPEHGDLASEAGHGGGDFWTNFHFANAIRSGEPPYLDVYRGVAMSSVGIIGWKSALEDGRPVEMPDWRREKSRKAYEDDNWSPDPEKAGPGQPPCSILGELKPSKEGKKLARQIWRQRGYKGKKS